MRKIALLLLYLVAVQTLHSQSPEKINYQAIIKDSNGNLVSNQNIAIQININQTTANGTTVYSETHAVTTSDDGLIALQIGDGTTTDNFSAISWGSNTYFLNVAVDLNNGTNYSDLGTQQLVSVPYALHAVTSTTSTSVADSDNDTKIQVEETTDEDVIRFDLEGTEYFRMNAGKIATLNNGFSVYIGENAGLNDDFSDNENVGIGYKALELNVTAGANTSIGAFSLGKSETGFSNTAIGTGAMQNNVSGDENVSIGVGSLGNIIDSNGNVGIGFNSGLNNTGEKNVFIGSEATISGNISNRLVIDNSNTTDPLIDGDFLANTLNINGELSINDNFSFPTTDGTNGQVLSTNGSGAVSWQSIPITSNTGNLFVGNNAGTNVSDSGNVLIGPRAGRDLTSNIDNTMVGNGAGESNTGNRNTFMGYLAGQNNTGSDNTFIGYRAGQNNALGTNNVFIGPNTGSNESGSNKLYIDNSNTSAPLIFGDFYANTLKVNGTLETTSNTTVGGTLKIGSSSTLSGIYKASIFKNVGSVSGNSSRIETFTINGVSPGDVVFVSPSENLSGQIVISQCWVSANNTVSVKFRNTDGGSKDPDESNGATYYFGVIK
ncbi:hypothetical protein KORDIASMS9_03914 [Kordia sp. SMS9]|uniref:beta strand repeat-containing protein n=1 Tax=Kordia sp. SMS9 TaxID=2282170 RepID=UPI000E0DF0E5|nr:hypothetical protein [Kordia sp. SMS9]AXG71657.1 hypothetical protein KORDIASMS9_03914 [Kordia sp. SMS9]